MARPALDWPRLDPSIKAMDRMGLTNRMIAGRLGISERSVYLRKAALGMQKRILPVSRSTGFQEAMRHAA